MRRRYKLLAVLMAVPLVLVLAGALLLPLLADSMYYKRQVIALVEKHTGLTLHIDGEVHLHLLPRLRITATHLRLANPPGFGSGDLARLPWLAVDVKLLPLIAGRVETGAIVLTGLTLNLERDAAGRGNWQGNTAKDAPSSEEQQTDATVSLAALAIGEINIRDASLLWQDAAGNEMTRVSAINLQTGALRGDQGIEDLRVQLELDDGAALELRGDVTLGAAGTVLVMPELEAHFHQTMADLRMETTVRTRLEADLADQALRLDSLRLSARGTGSGERRLVLELTTALAFDLARQRLVPSRFLIKVPDYSQPGSHGEGTLTGVAFGDLGAARYAFEQLEGSGIFTGEALGGARLALALGGTLTADVQRRAFAAPGLTITGRLDGDGVPFQLLADLNLSTQTRTLAATNMRLSIDDWQVDGALTLRSDTEPAALQGVLDVRIQGQPVAGNFAVSESTHTQGAADLRLDLVADLDSANNGYNLRGRHALVVRAKVHAPADNGWRRIEVLNMGARLTDSANPGAERIIKLQANLDVNSNAEHLRTDDLLLSIDDSQIVGSLSIQHFDKPALRLDLQADRIDADRYLLAGAAQSGTAKSSPPLGASIEALRALDFEGEVRVQALTFKGLTMHDVRLTSGAPGG
jgi:hypothetical protein